MTYTFPHTIEGPSGETIIFKGLQSEPDGERLLLENVVPPNAGPPMHVHFRQEESLTVQSGRLAYQVPGQAPQYAGPGETVTFERGVAHRFWNAGDAPLRCTGWIKPANSIVFFLTSIYAAQQATGTERPELFDAAYLNLRYRREYDMPDIPVFVKKVVMPVAYGIGWMMGKYRKFDGAPKPLR